MSAGQLVLLRALAAIRLLGVVPLIVVLYLRRETLDRPILALALVVAVAAFTTWATVALRYDPTRLLDSRVCMIDLAIAALVLAGDGWILGWEHTFYPPSLGAIWPLAATMTAGVAYGPWIGLAAGTSLALLRLTGAAAPEVQHHLWAIDDFLGDVPRLVPTLSLVTLYAAAGLGAGYLTRLQRRAETEIVGARAREEVARTLHDGVLQTLAIFQRRSQDPELTRLARNTDRELRSFLTGLDHVGPADLESALRDATATFAHRFDLTPQVMIDDPPAQQDDQTIQAIHGAVSEALANVGKHANASRVVVYAGPHQSGGLLVTIYDDGQGFDPRTVPPDRGMARSMRDRLNAVGAAVEVRTAPQQGSEVRIWVP